MASFNLQWRTSTKKDLRKILRDMVPRIVAEVEKLLYGHRDQLQQRQV